MNHSVLHRADTRGHADHGWLNARHSFSFARWHDPERIHFGVLRVLNDDIVAGGGGFPPHPHDNMEIITIPLEGALAHSDSMHHRAVIHAGDVQVMSAGTGVRHSEFNASDTEPVNLLQIWLFPNQRNVPPRYQQITLEKAEPNELQQILSPNPEDAGVWIHQHAWFHLGTLTAGFETTYHLREPANGVYAFVIEGDVTINGQDLHRRDGFGIWSTETLDIRADSDARLLLMEVPMSFE